VTGDAVTPEPGSAASGRSRDPECIFCRIVAGEVASTSVAEDDTVLAIRDIAPRAPTHVLLLPREHIPSAADLTEADATLLGRLFAMSAAIARNEGIADGGYRVVTNVGTWGGQSVDHLHFHLMGGRPFSWPPG
jgi:histidine triad (HIT) family protein